MEPWLISIERLKAILDQKDRQIAENLTFFLKNFQDGTCQKGQYHSLAYCLMTTLWP